MTRASIVSPPLPHSTPADYLEAKGIELFRAGIQIDAKGHTKQWSIADLDEIVETYNEGVGGHDAPILVGHDGNTSFGWLSKVYRRGDVLKGDYKELDEEFAEAVNAGKYKKRSISIYPRDYPHNPTPGKLNIRHLAYVGVPAIKGLRDHKFAEGDDGGEVYEFGINYFGTPFQTIAQILQALRDRLIEDGTIEAAEKQIPQEAIALLAGQTSSLATMEDLWRLIEGVTTRISALEARLGEPNNLLQQTFQEQRGSMTTQEKDAVQNAAGTDTGAKPGTENLTAEFAEMRSQMDALRTENEGLQGENNTLRQRLDALEDEREKDRVRNFIEGLATQTERKVLPSDVDSKIELALSLPHGESALVDFSEGEKTIKLSPRDRYLQDLANGRELWSNKPLPTRPNDAPAQFAEAARTTQTHPTADFTEKSVDDDTKIRNYMTQHSCSYQEAFNALSATGAI